MDIGIQAIVIKASVSMIRVHLFDVGPTHEAWTLKIRDERNVALWKIGFGAY